MKKTIAGFRGKRVCMKVEFTLFPGGATHALTLSYDDGTVHDRRLVEIFNTYGIRGTFHLNSGTLGTENHIRPDEVAALYAGHEVSCHLVTHPFPVYQADTAVLREGLDDRAALEALCGYVVRGMSYPFGNYNARVIALLRAAGMEYSRTTRSTGAFALPEDFMAWHPTCHHRENALDKLDEFLAPQRFDNGRVFDLWGHSYEFHDHDNWALMEEFCKRAGGRADTWYATNIQIVDYVHARRAIRAGTDGRTFFNPTATDVWVRADGEAAVLPAGQLTRL
ncbi:MAG: polysaccharide deacetylase family protein [Eubacteriales bacterium]|nr:polysaccharide deacetylase family protein [Eubacteriales bacterium]